MRVKQNPFLNTLLEAAEKVLLTNQTQKPNRDFTNLLGQLIDNLNLINPALYSFLKVSFNDTESTLVLESPNKEFQIFCHPVDEQKQLLASFEGNKKPKLYLHENANIEFAKSLILKPGNYCWCIEKDKKKEKIGAIKEITSPCIFFGIFFVKRCKLTKEECLFWKEVVYSIFNGYILKDRSKNFTSLGFGGNPENVWGIKICPHREELMSKVLEIVPIPLSQQEKEVLEC